MEPNQNSTFPTSTGSVPPAQIPPIPPRPPTQPTPSSAYSSRPSAPIPVMPKMDNLKTGSENNNTKKILVLIVALAVVGVTVYLLGFPKDKTTLEQEKSFTTEKISIEKVKEKILISIFMKHF